MRSWTLARKRQGSALAMVASTSLAKRRSRMSQARARSDDPAAGQHLEAFGGTLSSDSLGLATPRALRHGLSHPVQSLAHLRIADAVVGPNQFHGLALDHHVIR